MTAVEKILWNRIENFKMDDPQSAFSFSSRLARENGWSNQYTQRVIGEYKKFIFLCWITNTGVTPSDAVDQAWHLHLTYTRSYWIELCRDTLDKEIHHNPTKGGKKEAGKFDDFYTSTFQLYREKFETEPPKDIWPDNNTRFSDINFQRVNLEKYWLIRKRPFSKRNVIVLATFVFAALFIQATNFARIAILVFAVPFVMLIIASIIKSGNNKNDSNGGGSGCSTTTSDSGHHHGDSGCGSGCSVCSGSGCSGCGGGCSG